MIDLDELATIIGPALIDRHWAEVKALIIEVRESRKALAEVRERTKDRPAYSRCLSTGHWCLTDFTHDQMEGNRMRLNKIAFDLTSEHNEV